MSVAVDQDTRSRFLVQELEFLLENSGLSSSDLKCSDLVFGNPPSTFHLIRVNRAEKEEPDEVKEESKPEEVKEEKDEDHKKKEEEIVLDDIEEKFAEESGRGEEQPPEISEPVENQSLDLHTPNPLSSSRLSPKEKPRMLLLHGFGGSAASFYRLLGPLSEHFELVAADLPGMGFNSRPDRPFDSLETCLDFFSSQIKELADGLGWEKFNLLGHSVGAFLSAHFFDRNPSRIESLFLVSPAGFLNASEESHRRAEARIAQRHWLQRLVLRKLQKEVLHNKRSPFEIKVPLIGNYIQEFLMKRFFSLQKGKVSPSQASALSDLMRYHFSLPQSGERCAGYLLSGPTVSEAPLLSVCRRHKDRLSDLRIFFGEKDHMEPDLTLKCLKDEDLKVKAFSIPDSDHQVLFQNPEFLAKVVLREAKGEESPGLIYPEPESTQLNRVEA